MNFKNFSRFISGVFIIWLITYLHPKEGHFLISIIINVIAFLIGVYLIANSLEMNLDWESILKLFLQVIGQFLIILAVIFIESSFHELGLNLPSFVIGFYLLIFGALFLLFSNMSDKVDDQRDKEEIISEITKLKEELLKKTK